ncbi:c-type cytochrome [Roseovarius salinarum]|uniref:c-type cytochrome n=1 Tax=Roseovarius salinarum TaxID=1981892 RepID=UPI001E5E1B89|nr:c-type cytochrome [Roseovarius salinarum]
MLAPAAAAQDAEKGEQVFRQCAACHDIGEGAENRVGPALTGVIGRAAGSRAGFDYSRSMEDAGAAGLVWTKENLFAYLAGPSAFLRDHLGDEDARARMPFKLPDAQKRRDVIAYLAGFGDDGDTADADRDDPAGEAGAKAGSSGTAPQVPPRDTAAGRLCVRNLSARAHLFAVEADGADRRVKTLESGGVLCIDAPQAETGVVSVYESEDAFEGCSRITPVGTTEDMLEYVDFDRCFWRSNT